MFPFEKDIPLRERKQARTKVSLAKEFVAGVEETGYDKISIKEVCERAEVSEGTFYNYFPQKKDIMNYIASLYCVKSVFDTDQKVSRESPLEYIEAFLINMVRAMENFSKFSHEFIDVMLRERFKPEKTLVPELELFYAFPEYAGKKGFRSENFETLLDDLISTASEKGLVRKEVSLDDVRLFIDVVLFGTIIMAGIEGRKDQISMIENQLAILWRGIRK
ncbi:MAG: TetR/AcrR family transcriptional regulator [Candidatus Omnitrophota bacterium]